MGNQLLAYHVGTGHKRSAPNSAPTLMGLAAPHLEKNVVPMTTIVAQSTLEHDDKNSLSVVLLRPWDSYVSQMTSESENKWWNMVENIEQL